LQKENTSFSEVILFAASAEQASGGASFLPDKNSFPEKKGRLCSSARRKNDLFAAWKRMVSGCTRNAPFLPLNYRDARTVMSQNAKGITSDDINPSDRIVPSRFDPLDPPWLVPP
jgi:hypothetical protein